MGPRTMLFMPGGFQLFGFFVSPFKILKGLTGAPTENVVFPRQNPILATENFSVAVGAPSFECHFPRVFKFLATENFSVGEKSARFLRISGFVKFFVRVVAQEMVIVVITLCFSI